MASSQSHPAGRIFHRRLLGYRRGDVDRYVEHAERHRSDDQAELERLREHATRAEDIGKHLADLLVRFAESVAAGEREAREQANHVIADAEARAELIEAEARKLLAEAEDLAAATFAEAGRRYEVVTAAHNAASERIEDAIERMADALASLKAIPQFPDVPRAARALRDANVVHFPPAGDASG